VKAVIRRIARLEDQFAPKCNRTFCAIRGSARLSIGLEQIAPRTDEGLPTE